MLCQPSCEATHWERGQLLTIRRFQVLSQTSQAPTDNQSFRLDCLRFEQVATAVKSIRQCPGSDIANAYKSEKWLKVSQNNFFKKV